MGSMQPQRKLVLGQTTTLESFPPLGLAIRSSLPLITALGPWTVGLFRIQFKSPSLLCGWDLGILVSSCMNLSEALSVVF